MQFSLSFYGGAGMVTGANFLLEGAGKKLLIDCGLEQGHAADADVNAKAFPYDPASIDALIVTHAHMDHIGRIPLLVRRGLAGSIYSTPATRDLAELMFKDALGIMQYHAQHGGPDVLYEKQDVDNTLSLWETVPYHTPTVIAGLFELEFKDAGHILGSAMVLLTRVNEKERGGTIVFTGDLGNSPSPLLRDTEHIEDADYVVMESVYGDRLHEDKEDRALILRRVIADTITRKGVLLIPTFSIERTQDLLYELNNLVESGVIPEVPVFLDSPLAIKVTEVYRKRIKLFNDGVKEDIASGDDIFNFPNLTFTETTEESKEINHVPPPKIIIAGAGMSHGGRIRFHEVRYLPQKNTTLLFVGYQVAGSLGRIIQDGAKKVTILHETVPVRARIATLSGYSAHRDRNGLVEFAGHFKPDIKKVFVTMGEPKASNFLVQRLRDYLDLPAVAPREGESVQIEL